MRHTPAGSPYRRTESLSLVPMVTVIVGRSDDPRTIRLSRAHGTYSRGAEILRALRRHRRDMWGPRLRDLYEIGRNLDRIQREFDLTDSEWFYWREVNRYGAHTITPVS